MVLCRKCAHKVGLRTLACPRCGWRLPYYRSRHWKPRMALNRPAMGKSCPRCGERTSRQHTPLWLRPVRLLTLHRCSYRGCPACGWRGAAFHARSHGKRRRRSSEGM
ncbi:MAG TPA: hypothetical protein VEW03_05675 [Longimicrobiaceae bacterium]|nr:hypothetical protein [Longimicrobiaceae bacterium]